MVDAIWYGTALQQDLRNALTDGLEIQERIQCAFRQNDNTDSLAYGLIL